MEPRNELPDQGIAQRTTDATGLIISYPLGAYERLAVLQTLAARLTPRHIYTEQEMNALIQRNVLPSAADHLTVRRDLVDYQLIHRTDSGTRYWRSTTTFGVLPEVHTGLGTIGPNHIAGERETE